MTRDARTIRAPFLAALALIGTLLVWHLVGLVLFTSGFLLQRVELTRTSSCTTPPSATWSIPTPPRGAVEGQAEALRAWDAALTDAQECTLPPRFRRAVVWIVDALRYDFIAQATPGTSPAPDAYMHNILQTPFQVTQHQPRSSFLAHFVAHPPTTTLQRLKGLTTGSLPTFIEAGANFGGAGRVQEDTWIAQVRGHPAAKNLSFVGDDTWQMVFADLFDEVVPYSSFNVEDLDTVDAGVQAHFQERLQRDDWTLLIAHSLGVDHVGHRFGPSHARMPPKLSQMDDMVQMVLNTLQDDTLFVLLGDHGMDATGDHGGDSELEIGSALWMHANKPFEATASRWSRPAKMNDLTLDPDVQTLLSIGTPTPSFQPFSTLPLAPFEHGHRSLPQIDLVPTMSLLMGVPIPFNNLGAIIPEIFTSQASPLGASDSRLLRALRINARQVKTYLDEYVQHATDLQPFAHEWANAWATALQADAAFATHPSADTAQAAAGAYLLFIRLALDRAQSVWATFEYARIALGLAVLFTAWIVTWQWWRASTVEATVALARRATHGCVRGSAVGVPLGLVARYVVGVSWLEGVAACTALATIVATCFTRSAVQVPCTTPRVSTIVACLVLGVHAMLFASNSFTMWEDRITLALVAAILLVRAIQGLGAPLPRWQQRMPLLALGALILLRVAGMSRVCREEQAPYCQPSFYARSTSTMFADNPAYALSGPATNSKYAIGMAYLVAFGTADALRRLLMPSQAHLGSSATLLQWFIRPAMLGAAGYWLADWVQGWEQWDDATRDSFFTLKVWVARLVFLVLGGGMVYWVLSPLSLSVLREPSANGGQPRVMILGFGNTFGSAFLGALTIVYAWLFLVSQPMGQLALTACLVSLVLLAELGDHERDAQVLLNAKVKEASSQTEAQPQAEAPSNESAAKPTRQAPTLLEVACIMLLGFVAFFATGHQATLSAIQWRVAFVGMRSVTYPWSPLFVTLNAFGPLAFLPVLGVALLTLWNMAPHRVTADAPHPIPMRLIKEVLHGLLGALAYMSTLSLSTAVWALFFRRHLMLFKIWVPRFMTAALGLFCADLSALLAIGCVWILARHVHKVFGTTFT